MSAPKVGEFGEPWEQDGDGFQRFVRIGGVLIADTNTPAQAERIVSCVNALSGHDPAALTLLLEAARGLMNEVSAILAFEPEMREAAGHTNVGCLLRRRDALRAALAAFGKGRR